MQVGDYKSHFAETRITFGADRHASGSARARHLKSRLSKVLATIMGGSDGDYVPPRADLDFTRVDFGLDARRGRRHQHSTNIRNWATCGPKPAAERRKKSLSRRDIAYDRDIQSEARRTLLTATPTHSLSISCRFVMRWSYASSRLHPRQMVTHAPAQARMRHGSCSPHLRLDLRAHGTCVTWPQEAAFHTIARIWLGASVGRGGGTDLAVGTADLFGALSGPDRSACRPELRDEKNKAHTITSTPAIISRQLSRRRLRWRQRWRRSASSAALAAARICASCQQRARSTVLRWPCDGSHTSGSSA